LDLFDGSATKNLALNERGAESSPAYKQYYQTLPKKVKTTVKTKRGQHNAEQPADVFFFPFS
jgi:hypothetical protein